jgi:hypothetical protein
MRLPKPPNLSGIEAFISQAARKYSTLNNMCYILADGDCSEQYLLCGRELVHPSGKILMKNPGNDLVRFEDLFTRYVRLAVYFFKVISTITKLSKSLLF